MMNRPRDEFFAGSGLAENQDRRIGAGDFLDVSEHTEQSLALADNFIRAK